MNNNVQEILEHLRRARKENPALAEVVDLQRDLIQAREQVQAPPVQPQCSGEEAQAGLVQGRPLIHSQDIALDWGAFAGLYQQVCRITAQHRPDLAAHLEKFLALLDDDPGQVRALALAYIGDREGDRDELSDFVLNHALRPFLEAFAGAYMPLVKQEVWQRGRCLMCGGEPDMAFLEQEPVSRYLLCSRCDTQWLYPRIKCPFCDNSDPHTLSYYANEDGVYRVYVCEKCQRYLKAVDLRKARRRVLLAAERITTVALDIAAREKGYR
jgi:formate dehydrogenase accessory protein FdhE